MTFLHAYFDESGKQHDHPAVTFTGVCVSGSRLSTFDSEWGVLLRQYGLKSLHMAKASRLKENCGPKMPRHQKIEERIQALVPFADCINKNLVKGLIQAIDVKGFKEMSNRAKQGLGSPDDPYYLAFARGILELIDYVQGEDKISLICDDDESTAWNCYLHYRAIRKVHEEVRRKIVSLTFATDDHFPALQAADMVAFLSRLEARRMFYKEYNPFQPLFDSLVRENGAGGMDWYSMFATHQKLKELGDSLGKLKKKK